MIYMTGDTHGNFSRFADGHFPQQASMTKNDYVMICGDFGGVWNTSKQQSDMLDWLNARPFTTLFITGNHENYDLLATYPVSEWHGGKVQFIRPSVIHLMRGQIYEIDGQTFFTMGGAACHDIYNGVLDMSDPAFDEKYNMLRARRKFFRINHQSWWEQELPTEDEIRMAHEMLCAHEKKVDYIISHCAPTQLQKEIQSRIGDNTHPENELTAFLQWIYDECQFKHWYCGHYHQPMDIKSNFHVLYEKIIPLGDSVYPFVEASEEYGNEIIEKIVALFQSDIHGEKSKATNPEGSTM